MRYLLISALIILGDQCVKSWVTANMAINSKLALIPGLVQMTHINNYGAAFSMLEGKRIFFLILTAIVCAAILIALLTGKISDSFGKLSAAMLLGGALGNAIDRAATGYVVDMFEFTFVSFAIFNVADIFITFGGALFCIYILKLEYADRRKKAALKAAQAGSGSEEAQQTSESGEFKNADDNSGE
ncbi:MAG: signal peptidase II [Papillibacter sp.]|jgi:signal peptidase II|nr:signal peptidase II [Papillibacter sp.]